MGDRPLVGVRVLELAVGIAGPYGGKLLSDLGADVVKAEPPDGDPTRQRGPFRDPSKACPDAGRVGTSYPDPEASGFFLYLNAGKRGITLDLDDEAGRAALLDLVGSFDVPIESFPPGELDRLGVGVAALQARNPKLSVVSATPWGQTGPQAGWRGNDLIAFHSSGFAYGFPSREIESADLPPLNAPSHAADFLAGEVVAGAAVHGLLLAQRDGVVDVGRLVLSGHGLRLLYTDPAPGVVRIDDLERAVSSMRKRIALALAGLGLLASLLGDWGTSWP